MQRFNFPVIQPETALEELRGELQVFLKEELEAGHYRREPECWMSSADPEFSKKMGTHGWIGLTWSSQYGGTQARCFIHADAIEGQLQRSDHITRRLRAIAEKRKPRS